VHKIIYKKLCLVEQRISYEHGSWRCQKIVHLNVLEGERVGY
jgi:hypothetical protein